MSISAASISHALHGIGHHGITRPHGPAERFEGQLGTGTQQAGQQPSGTTTDKVDARAGGLLSADMLRVMQTIGQGN